MSPFYTTKVRKYRKTRKKQRMHTFCSNLVARGFGPFRIWPPEVSAFFRFGPGGFGPHIYQNVIFFFANFFLYLFYPCFPITSDRSPELCTTIKQGPDDNFYMNFDRSLIPLPSSLSLQVRSFLAFYVIAPKWFIIWSFVSRIISRCRSSSDDQT